MLLKLTKDKGEEMKLKIIHLVLITAFTSYSRTGGEFNNAWQLGLTFGEIPVLAGSFKPGITLGYHLNENFMLEFIFQLKDRIQRDNESFNAQNTEIDALESSKETTGERLFFGVRYKPLEWSPYISAGFVFNNEDVETMSFADKKRILGRNSYSTNVTVMQKRNSGFAPAFGFGYQYDFVNNLSINTSFAMAFLTDIAEPDVTINSKEKISAEDTDILIGKIKNVYKDNFHNRYHIFNLGLTYRFN